MQATDSSNQSQHDHLPCFSEKLKSDASFLFPAFVKQQQIFGADWEARFEELLRVFIATDKQKMNAAIEGYAKFAMDGMRLQKRFEKSRQYINKTYEQAASEVYHNKDYMFSRYLPGLILSHYLWPHHYRQYQFFEKAFLPLVMNSKEAEFCDIGVGTGFYSRVLLTSCAKAKGWAFDISEYALEYGRAHLSAYGVAERWVTEIRNIENNPPLRRWPFLLSIEVLEHLEDPLSFLKALRNMLSPGGFAFISAAVTAAEKDHIFLYNSSQEVLDQIQEAGFKLIDQQEDAAYPQQGDVPVPINVAFIVTTN
jgi:2-polyprenyl-3-methyl-5-hydroxy-6-metoxy-1,4-benzoquinol methylase